MDKPDLSCHQERAINARVPRSFFDRICWISIVSCAIPIPPCNLDPYAIACAVFLLNPIFANVARVEDDCSFARNFILWIEIGKVYSILGI